MSAEAFGDHNKKGDYTGHVIPKSDDTKAKILTRLNMAFMFQALDEKEK